MATQPTAKAIDPSSEACLTADRALARAFEFLGKRWTAVILGLLGAGPAGFRDVSRAVSGISDSVLSDRLAELTRAGLVSRRVEEGPPLSVSYSLTDCGEALLPSLEQVSLWAREHLPETSRTTARSRAPSLDSTNRR